MQGCVRPLPSQLRGGSTMTEQSAPKTDVTLQNLSADAARCSRDLIAFLPLSIPRHLHLCSVSRLFPVWSEEQTPPEVWSFLLTCHLRLRKITNKSDTARKGNVRSSPRSSRSPAWDLWKAMEMFLLLWLFPPGQEEGLMYRDCVDQNNVLI